MTPNRLWWRALVGSCPDRRSTGAERCAVEEVGEHRWVRPPGRGRFQKEYSLLAGPSARHCRRARAQPRAQPREQTGTQRGPGHHPALAASGLPGGPVRAPRHPPPAPHSVRRSPAGPTENQLSAAPESCHPSSNSATVVSVRLASLRSGPARAPCMAATSRVAQVSSRRRNLPDAPSLVPTLTPAPRGRSTSRKPGRERRARPEGYRRCPPRLAGSDRTLPVGQVNLDPPVADGLARRVPHRAGQPLSLLLKPHQRSTPPPSSRASSPGSVPRAALAFLAARSLRAMRLGRFCRPSGTRRR